MRLNYTEQGDCLELMKDIPDGSIDMILCDLPYGNINGMVLKGWDSKTTSWDSKLDGCALFTEYERVLRKNGTIVLFSMCPYTSELRSGSYTNIKFAYPLIWKKDHFASPFSAKKAPVSYFEDISVFYKVHDGQLLNPLRPYFAKILDFIGFSSCKDVNNALGHRRAEHVFYINSTQFSLCTEKTYRELIDKFHIDEMDGFKTFGECEKIERTFKRTFNLPEGCGHLGNVLEFKKDYQGLHPTQKPVALLEYLIKIYTNKGEIVLDNCMGSGSTCVACIRTGRKYIGFELDEKYHTIAQERIAAEIEAAAAAEQVTAPPEEDDLSWLL